MKAILCSLFVVLFLGCALIQGQQSASTTNPPSVAVPPIQQQPKEVQNFVKSVSETLAAVKPQKPNKLKFLRNILKELRSLGLVKSVSEQAPFNFDDAVITLKKVVKVTKHLKQLKKEGKKEDLDKYVADLKKSANFAEAVRLVRRVMRRLLRREVRKLARMIRRANNKKQSTTTTTTTTTFRNVAAPSLKYLLRKVTNKKPAFKRINRRHPIENILRKLRTRRFVRPDVRRFLDRKPRNPSRRQFRDLLKNLIRRREQPRRQATRRPRRNLERRPRVNRRTPRRDRRVERRPRVNRRIPAERRSIRVPRFLVRRPIRFFDVRRNENRQQPRRLPRREIRRPKLLVEGRNFNRRRPQPRRMPRRDVRPRRMPRENRRAPRRDRRVPRRPRKPFLVVRRDMIRHIVQSWLKNKAQ